MKKLLLFIVMSSVALSVSAQKMDASKVPVAVKTSFEKQYPGLLPNGKKKMEIMK